MEGKVALVTGASRGIGLAIARRLLREKVKVVICARKPAGLEAARLELENLVGEGPGAGAAPYDLLAVPAHIAEEAEVERLFAATLERFGRLDILVNNVGMNLLTPSVAEADPAAWRKIIDTNLTGTYLCSRRAAAIMRPRKAGKIISLSSTAGRVAAPGLGIYGVAKGRFGLHYRPDPGRRRWRHGGLGRAVSLMRRPRVFEALRERVVTSWRNWVTLML